MSEAFRKEEESGLPSVLVEQTTPNWTSPSSFKPSFTPVSVSTWRTEKSSAVNCISEGETSPSARSLDEHLTTTVSEGAGCTSRANVSSTKEPSRTCTTPADVDTELRPEPSRAVRDGDASDATYTETIVLPSDSRPASSTKETVNDVNGHPAAPSFATNTTQRSSPVSTVPPATSADPALPPGPHVNNKPEVGNCTIRPRNAKLSTSVPAKFTTMGGPSCSPYTEMDGIATGRSGTAATTSRRDCGTDAVTPSDTTTVSSRGAVLGLSPDDTNPTARSAAV